MSWTARLIAVVVALWWPMLGLAEVRTTTHQDWVSVCQTVEGVERCHMAQTLEMETEQGRNRLLEATIGRVAGANVLQLVLPLGVDLRPGIVMRIDEGKEFTAPYLMCMQGGCTVAIQLDDSLLQAMRAGLKGYVGFRPFNSEQTLVLEMSLRGFTRASNAIR